MEEGTGKFDTWVHRHIYIFSRFFNKSFSLVLIFDFTKRTEGAVRKKSHFVCSKAWEKDAWYHKQLFEDGCSSTRELQCKIYIPPTLVGRERGGKEGGSADAVDRLVEGSVAGYAGGTADFEHMNLINSVSPLMIATRSKRA